MAVVKNLMVRAGADFSAITTQANKASKSMRGMQSSVSRSCSLMTKAVSGVKKVLGAVGIGLGVASLVNYGKEAAQAYDTQMQSEMKLAAVMRNTMGASNAEIQSIMDLTAAEQQLGVVGDEVQLAGAQQLSTYLHLSSSLQTLIPAMNDLAVQQYGLNVSEEQAVSIAKLFGKAMEGQTSALTQYGFTVSAAQQQVMKYGSEEERAATLADIVRARVGGMNAALASTPTGRMQQLKSTLGDIKERFGQAVRTIGTVFLPILNAVGSALAGIATIANKVAQTIASVFGGTAAGKEWQWSGVSAGISETADAVDDLTDAQNGSAGAAKKQKEALQTASFDTLNILKATDAAGSGGGYDSGSGYSGGSISPIAETGTAAEEAGESIGWLQEKLEKLKSGWEDFKSKLGLDRLKVAWEDLKKAASSFVSAVAPLLEKLWNNVLKPLTVWIINQAIPGILKLLSESIIFLTEMVGKVKEGVKSFGDTIKGSFSTARATIDADMQNMSDAAADFVRRTKDAWSEIKASFARGRESISTGLQNLVASFRDSDKSIFDSVVDLARRIGDAWIDIKSSFTRGKESISTGLQNLDASIKRYAQNIFDGISWPFKKIEELYQGLVAPIRNIGQKILDGFTSPFKKAYDWITQIVNKIRNLLNFKWSIPRPKIPSINWSWKSLKVGDSSISLPKFSVDWYAKGGVFDRASLIGVGENGREAVVPLERNTGWISKVATELAAQMAGGAGMLGSEALIEGIHDAVYEAMMAVMGMQTRGESHKTVFNVNGREFFRAVWDDYKAVARERGVSLINT